MRRRDGVRIIADGKEQEWIFDFRAVLLDPGFLNLAAEAFWERFGGQYPFQVGGLETAGIPLVAAIVMKGVERGTPVNGFYIRKSRKPQGLQKIIEGTLTNDQIILVDDLANKGSSFVKQIEILKREGRAPAGLFTLVRFRDLAEYRFLELDNVELTSLFSLADFDLKLGSEPKLADRDAFTEQWAVRFPHPNFFYRIPKSGPALDECTVYIGSDEGIMHAIDQATGEERWSYRMLGRSAGGRTIFSTPVVHQETLYFGAYDGNFYALDTSTGKKRWIYMDADWIGASPAVVPDQGLVCVGLMYGLWNRRGGFVALDMRTGKKRWEHTELEYPIRSAAAYAPRRGAVAVGSMDGVRLFQVADGKLLWLYKTAAEVTGSVAFDEERGLAIFGSFDGILHVVDVTSGVATHTFATRGGVATPCVHDGRAYFSSLDKCIYCLNLDTYTLEWSFATDGRIFAAPIIADGYLYVGSNDGRFYELDLSSGRNTAFIQANERITNAAAYNSHTRRFFVSTYANELACITRKQVQ